MVNPYIYLVIAEILIIALVFGIKMLLNHLENKKINSILKYIDKKSKENSGDIPKRFEECIEIIKQSNKQSIND